MDKMGRGLPSPPSFLCTRNTFPPTYKAASAGKTPHPQPSPAPLRSLAEMARLTEEGSLATWATWHGCHTLAGFGTPRNPTPRTGARQGGGFPTPGSLASPEATLG